MARIANNLKTQILRANNYLKEKTIVVDNALKKLDEIDAELVPEGFTAAKITAYKNKIRAEGTADFLKGAQMYQWMIDLINETVPVPYTDAEVDAEDPDIRTFEDGT